MRSAAEVVLNTATPIVERRIIGDHIGGMLRIAGIVADEETVGDRRIDIDVVGRAQHQGPRLAAIGRAIGEIDLSRSVDRARAEIPIAGDGDIAAIHSGARIIEIDLRPQMQRAAHILAEFGGDRRIIAAERIIDEAEQRLLIEGHMIGVHIAARREDAGGRIGGSVDLRPIGAIPAGRIDNAVEMPSRPRARRIGRAPDRIGVERHAARADDAVRRALIEAHIHIATAARIGGDRRAQRDGSADAALSRAHIEHRARGDANLARAVRLHLLAAVRIERDAVPITGDAERDRPAVRVQRGLAIGVAGIVGRRRRIAGEQLRARIDGDAAARHAIGRHAGAIERDAAAGRPAGVDGPIHDDAALIGDELHLDRIERHPRRHHEIARLIDRRLEASGEAAPGQIADDAARAQQEGSARILEGR